MSLLRKLHFLLQNKTKCYTYLQAFRKIPTRHYATADDDIDPVPEGLQVKVSALSRDLPSTFLVKSYSSTGFVFTGGIQVFGPCVVFPKSILHWNVRDASDINEDSLSLLTMLEPKLDLLLLGVGDTDDVAKIKPDTIIALKKQKINLEITTTNHALQMFNFMNSENRYLGGAFIPAAVKQPLTVSDDTVELDNDGEVSEVMRREPKVENDTPLVFQLFRQIVQAEDSTDDMHAKHAKRLKMVQGHDEDIK